jgi:SAM-dependent methyltransferase
MPEPPLLFDTSLRTARQKRARSLSAADYLHRELAAEIKERLAEINKPFPARFVVGTMAETEALALGARQIAESETLSLPEAGADLIVHALALHAANDPVGQLVQMRRALRPDGLMIAALLGTGTLQNLRHAFARAEIATTGGASPRVFPFGDLRDLGSLLQRAGFALPVADSLTWQVRTDDAVTFFRDLRAMGETNVLVARRRRFLRRDTLSLLEGMLRENQPDGGDGITWQFDVIFLTGWAPAGHQQQPLRPGSAATRLSDALGVPERPAGDKAGA